MRNSMISNEDAQNLLHKQLQEWPLLSNNYDLLSSNRTACLSVNNYDINIQFNPERIRSSTASVGHKEIKERKCFLCHDNRPAEQDFIIDNDYNLLINPYPVFEQHFTLPTISHIPQRIYNRFGDMLNYSKIFSDYIIFYNGPECGASAPDHFHFQLGNKNLLPIEKYDLLFEKQKKYFKFNNHIKIYTLEDYPATCIILEAKEKDSIVEYFNIIYKKLSLLQSSDKEPLLNIISWYNNGTYKTIIFPRTKHRPGCYFANDEEQQILISPASVEMGGILVLARECDFNKITPEIIRNVYSEVCLKHSELNKILNDL